MPHPPRPGSLLHARDDEDSVTSGPGEARGARHAYQAVARRPTPWRDEDETSYGAATWV